MSEWKADIDVYVLVIRGDEKPMKRVLSWA